MHQLLWIALATLASEDLALLTAGALVAQRRIGLTEATFAATAGIFAGDMMLFLFGRLAWKSQWLAAWIAKRVSRETLDRVSGWLQQRGLAVVLLSRLTPGMRLPTYIAAGLLGGPRAWTFAGYFLLAACLWTPLLVAGSAFLGEQILPRFGITVFAVVALSLVFAQSLGNYETRRSIVGFVRRKIRWEFWPAWAAYLPLVPYFLYLALRYRSLTLFTIANPGIATGGFAGESKSQILDHLNSVPGAVAPFRLLNATGGSVQAPDLEPQLPLLPVVLKPDAGERGKGVAIIRTPEQWLAYWRSASGAVIEQQYVPGEEFGIYYVRYPNESCGLITSITEKRFPCVIGDGEHSVRELILRDQRAVCLASAYRAALGAGIDRVPEAGHKVQLIEIGSHCRGAVFLDASHLVTPELTAVMDTIAQAHPGFHIGRFDVRAASTAALRQGDLKVIELNGVSAEPAHIYDPAVSLAGAYRTMMWQWRTAFEIGALHRVAGIEPMNVSAFLRALRAR